MKDMLTEVQQRTNSYRLLADCYYPPDGKLIRKIADAACANPVFAELTCYIPPVIEFGALKVDHARLFVGPYRLLAPPYGSVYLEDSRIMGDSTLDVRDYYESEDLNTVIKEAPDHIAVELEFVYYLMTKQIQAIGDEDLQMLQSCQRKQSSFLQTHLGRWLPGFVEKVLENAQTEFYRTLVNLTDKFVGWDVRDRSSCSAV
jgi:TorA maturation chaperone TorD